MHCIRFLLHSLLLLSVSGAEFFANKILYPREKIGYIKSALSPFNKDLSMFYKNILESIGTTSLVKLPFNCPATILAKLEYLNPGGSVKDRSALFMIEQAERDGRLKPGGTIVDASSGNHGIAVAMIAAAKGYKVIITVSEKISKEKLQTIQAYGAHVVMCPRTSFIDDPKSYHTVATRIARETPNSFMPNQYFNTENRDGHFTLLGPEIWEQTEGKVTHFFAGVGTGGTISGVGRYLKQQNPLVKVYGLDSINSFRSTQGNPKPYEVEGIGIDFTSDVLDYNVIDQIIPVSDAESFGTMRALAKHFGVLAGPTCGSVTAGMLSVADTLTKDSVVVLMFSDSGRAYLSKNLFDAPENEAVNPLFLRTPEIIPGASGGQATL